MDILQFSAEKWASNYPIRPNEKETDVFLECFLLHYRNLACLLASRDGMQLRDLAPCARSSPAPEELEARKDEFLYESYVGKISQYLSHCTKTRAKKTGWNIPKMYCEAREILSKFQDIFPDLQLSHVSFGRVTDEVSTASERVFGAPLGNV